MATPDPEGVGLLAKAVGYVVAIGTPIVAGWKWVDTRLDKKADKDSVEKAFEKVDAELTIQRGNQAKIFDQIRENEQRAQDRHEKILEAIYQRK